MKNLKLLTLTLLGVTVVLAGCNNSSKTEFNEDSWKEIIADDCVNFFDGCNNCTRVEGEEGAACTKMACETYEEPRCLDDEITEPEYNEDSWKEIIADDCVNFFDGCNNCTRVEGEEGAACTRMYCETYTEPRCTDDEIENESTYEDSEEVVSSAYDANSWRDLISPDCTNFYDGCNYCSRVEGTDEAACTMLFCENYDEPQCTDEVSEN